MTEHCIRIQKRARPDHWAILQEAAEYKFLDVNSFVMNAALKDARNVLAEKHEWDAFYAEFSRKPNQQAS